MHIAYFGYNIKSYSPRSILSEIDNSEHTATFFNAAHIAFYDGKMFYESKPIDITSFDAAIVRSCGTIKGDVYTKKRVAMHQIIRLLTDANIPTINGSFYLENPFYDKFSQSLLFAKKHIPTIPTIHPVEGSFVEKKDIPWDYPVILKEIDGSFGLSVYKINSYNELKKWTDENPQEDIILQKFVPNSSDYRVIVCGGNAVGIMKRTSEESGWKHNFSQGSKVEKHDDEKMCRFAEDVAKKIESDYVGIDILIDEFGEFLVIEINLSANFKGFESVYGDGFVASHIINTLENKKLY